MTNQIGEVIPAYAPNWNEQQTWRDIMVMVEKVITKSDAPLDDVEKKVEIIAILTEYANEVHRLPSIEKIEKLLRIAI